jgi:hypothetical protein
MIKRGVIFLPLSDLFLPEDDGLSKRAKAEAGFRSFENSTGG